MQKEKAHLFQYFLMPGTVLVEELGGRMLDRVLRFGELNQ